MSASLLTDAALDDYAAIVGCPAERAILFADAVVTRQVRAVLVSELAAGELPVLVDITVRGDLAPAPVSTADALTIVRPLQRSPIGRTIACDTALQWGSGSVVIERRLLVITPEQLELRRVNAPAIDAAAAEGSLALSEERTAAYAAVSGDDNPIHLDADVARRFGFAARPAHGMAVLALAVEAALAGETAPPEVGEVSARFVSPAFVGESLTIRHRPTSPHSTRFDVCAGSRTVLRSIHIVPKTEGSST
jgi:acyl dehydratase